MHFFLEILLVFAIGVYAGIAAILLFEVVLFCVGRIVDVSDRVRRKMSRGFGRRVTAVALMCALVLVTIPMAGCNSADFESILNEVGPAVSVILQIVSLVGGKPVSTSVAAKITGDVAALNKLYTDWEAAAAGETKATLETDIANAFQVLNADLSSVFALASVKDANTQAKISALIVLIESAVQIAEGFIPFVAAKTKASPVGISASDFVGSYNKILTAKTGNAAVDEYTAKHKIHYHGKVVRTLTLGLAQ